jgi:hypothetical protein
MLAHLVSLPVRSEKMFAACLVMFLAGYAGKSMAADLTPVSSYDAASTGNVSSAKTLEDGTVKTAVSISGSESVIGQDTYGGQDAEKQVLRDAHRATVFMGTSINKALELSLGISGTYEHVRPEDRDQVYPDGSGSKNPVLGEDEENGTWRSDFKQTGFSGLSLMLKMKLIDAGSLQISLAPFVETGAGEQASYSMTRSVGPKAGYIAMFSYGAKGVASLDVNGGYRYRNPEETGDLTIRNEAFYKALAKAYASRNIAVFVGAEGRKLMVAKNNERDAATGQLVYNGSESGEVKGGLLVTAGDFDLSASYGRRLKAATGFGYGSSSFTAGIGMTVGNYKRVRPTTSLATEIEKNEKKAELKSDGGTGKEIQPAAATVDEYPEMIGSDIDPLEALGKDEGEDFRDMEKRIKQYEAEAGKESEDAKIERELKDLKVAEELAAEQREKQEKIENEAQRRERVKASKEEEALRKEWLEEAEKEGEKSIGITKQELEWNGLN